MGIIKENLERLQARIEKICLSLDRNFQEIQLVAVTKTVEISQIEEAIQAGITIIGENRVQEAWKKYQVIGDRVKWHLVGHLQTNKVKRAVEFFEMIQSVDRHEVALEINRRAQALGKVMDVLVEVNTSGEMTKFGLSPQEVIPFISSISEFPGLHVCGLMTIGIFSSHPEEVRPCFRTLRQIKEEVEKTMIPGVEMKYLSMGMTNDFEVAIEEGSNMLRIGTAIFGERKIYDNSD